MRKHMRRWGAAWLLLGLWASSWAVHWWAEVRVGGATWDVFVASTFENLQSEWMQLLVQAVMLLALKHVLFKADAEDMEKLQSDLTQIKARLGLEED